MKWVDNRENFTVDLFQPYWHNDAEVMAKGLEDLYRRESGITEFEYL